MSLLAPIIGRLVIWAAPWLLPLGLGALVEKFSPDHRARAKGLEAENEDLKRQLEVEQETPQGKHDLADRIRRSGL